jgi:hypothetical protein
VLLQDTALRTMLLDALTQDNRLHLDEIVRLSTRLEVRRVNLQLTTPPM